MCIRDSLKGSVNLVDIAEKKLSGGPVDLNWIKTELSPMFDGRNGADIDAVVLACTHFPLLRDELKASVTQSVQWIDSGAAIAKRVETVLAELTQNKKVGAMHPREDIALLIGPNTDTLRRKAFASFGFNRVIGLLA